MKNYNARHTDFSMSTPFEDHYLSGKGYKEEKGKNLKEVIYNIISQTKKKVPVIAEELEIPRRTVSDYVKELKEEGRIPKDFPVSLYASQEELKDKICQLVLNQHNRTEIAKILDISYSLVSNYIRKLKEEERIPKDFTFNIRMSPEELKNQICTLVLEQHTQNEIAKTLNISVRTVTNYVEKLKEEGRISKGFTFGVYMSKESFQDEICKLVLKKHTQMEIAKTLNVTPPTIASYVKKLKKEGRISKDFKFDKMLIKKELKEKICQLLLKQQYSRKEIAELLSVAPPTITNYVKILKQEGKIPKDFVFVGRKKTQEIEKESPRC
ncbi:winged helix-turn-helix transcriptional regulator [Priestia filamentosa]|uniref:winged helix-turn-helix transcriptional regulator n=1 Tax=Priestia filamentosa TaxID=1402861 RepID=UPI003979D0A7